MLYLDAFTGDAIPVHLLTSEAFETYLRHLKPEGVICILISTCHLDFEPVIRRLADHFGLKAIRIKTEGDSYVDWGSDWMLLARNDTVLSMPPLDDAATEWSGGHEKERLWTDDYTSLLPLLDLN